MTERNDPVADFDRTKIKGRLRSKNLKKGLRLTRHDDFLKINVDYVVIGEPFKTAETGFEFLKVWVVRASVVKGLKPDDINTQSFDQDKIQEFFVWDLGIDVPGEDKTPRTGRASYVYSTRTV